MPHQWQNSRSVVERIVVEGRLELLTPASFGDADGDTWIDLPLLRDPLEGRALLTGASLAGALRNYLREREHGFFARGHPDDLAARLFGGERVTHGDAIDQSALIVYDALGERPDVQLRDGVGVDAGADRCRDKDAVPLTELRDGVAIDPSTRTAADGYKFDVELVEAGTTFPVRVELLATADDEAAQRRALALALQGLERGEIRVGARKRRGLGACRVMHWTVWRYDLRTLDGLLGWLAWRPGDSSGAVAGPSIVELLAVSPADLTVDARRSFTIRATFAVDGSLLIRSPSAEPAEPDAVHLRSRRPGRTVPILSGTSLAGALRARALRIATTLKDPEAARSFVDAMFGTRVNQPSASDDGVATDAREVATRPAGSNGAPADKVKLVASPLVVGEAEIENPLDLVHTRVKIDRFTGGAYPGALFSEQPVFGRLDRSTRVTVDLELRATATFDAQIGLLLLLLKDLWTGDLPIGGEAGVGRGCLRGVRAELHFGDEMWGLEEDSAGRLRTTGAVERLERYVQAFVEWGTCSER